MPENANSFESLSGPIHASNAQTRVDGVVDLGDVAASYEQVAASHEQTDGSRSATPGVYDAGDESSESMTLQASTIARRSRSHPAEKVTE